MNLIKSYWKTTEHIIATSLILENGEERWVDYDKNNPNNSYVSVKEAQIAGTLTGEVDPVDYPRPPLEEQRYLRLQETELKTLSIRMLGIPVTVGGVEHQWDTVAERADRNWLWLAVITILKAINAIPEGVTVFPRNIRDKYDSNVEIADIAASLNFLLTLKLSEQAILDVGAGIRKQLNDATTQEELDAVIDPR